MLRRFFLPGRRRSTPGIGGQRQPYKVDRSELAHSSLVAFPAPFRKDLAALYFLRGKKKKAKFYADKLPDIIRVDFWRRATHP
jgi:hypothetical protein